MKVDKNDKDIENEIKLKKTGYYITNNIVQSSDIENICKLYQDNKNNSSNRIVSPGRTHYELSSTNNFMSSSIIKNILTKSVNICLKELEIIDRNDIFLSTIQIVDSIPGSTSQLYHVDNAKKGITIVIPLVDINEKNGGTEMIIGSHNLFTLKNINEIDIKKLSIVNPLLEKGQAIVMDSRVIHRGMPNNSNLNRPILVIRYDNVHSPPPNIGILGTVFRNYVGVFIKIVFPNI